jgi:hypothetical protein
MPRKPNYSYERFQRQTAKTAKKEAKRQARVERLAQPGAAGQSREPIEATEREPEPERSSAAD